MEDKIIEEDIEMIDIMIIIEVGTSQEKGHLPEIIVVTEIEAQVIVDLGLVPELVQIEIGLDVTIVESMTILQEIVLILDKREDLERLQQMLNMKAEEQTYIQDSPHRKSQRSFKLMNSRDDTTTFLPLDSRIGGQNRDSPTVGQYLTRDQTKYIYKKVETGEMINTDMIQQEIKQEKQLGRIDDTSRETNPYKELIVNNVEKIEPLMTQMEQWSILSNVLNYVQHSRFQFHE